MFKYYFILFLIIIFLIRFNQHIIKGKVGEAIVAFFLLFLDKDEYNVINDIMLETDKGTTQIDHVVISKFGIFVIETKNYKGWIYGGEFSENWTKNMYGKKYNFYNPIKQNFGHIKALSRLLDIKESNFVPIIVFPLSATLKSEYKNHVSYFFRINNIIKKYKEKIITQDIQIINEKIVSANVNNKENRKKHIKSIKKKINESKNNICPKCGGKLVNKKGKYGYFMGCLNYPNCKYTNNINIK